MATQALAFEHFTVSNLSVHRLMTPKGREHHTYIVLSLHIIFHWSVKEGHFDANSER